MDKPKNDDRVKKETGIIENKNRFAEKISGKSDNKKSVYELRNTLVHLGFKPQDVYSLSLKFAGTSKAGDIKNRFDKILQSLHHSEIPDENYKLAIDVLLDELTVSEAIKKSYVKKSENEIRRVLSGYSWALSHIDELAKKYAGEKTPQEIISKFNLILREIPYSEKPDENTALAVSMLLDRKNYDKVVEKKQKVRFMNDLKNLFGNLSNGLIVKTTDRFLGKLRADKIFDKARRLLIDLGYTCKKENYVLALKILVGEVSKEESLIKLRKTKNEQLIKMLAKEFVLTSSQTKELTEKYCGSGSGIWFDEEFPDILNMLNKYPASEKENNFLALQVLLGKMSREKALDVSRIYKNTYLINKYGQKVRLSKKQVFKLASRYTKQDTSNFLDKDLSDITKKFKKCENLWNLVVLASVRVLAGEIDIERAKRLAEFYFTFDEFPLSKEDLDRIINKFLGNKNPGETAEIFRSILDKLPYKDSKEENYCLAVDVLLDGTADFLKRTVKRAQMSKERALFKEEIGKYGWFSGYTAEITDKFFPSKSAGEVIKNFEEILSKVLLGYDKELYYDIALKTLLGRISLEEAEVKARIRKDLSSVDWTKGFVREIENNYLGIRDIGEIIKEIGARFERFKFWRKNKSAHKFILDKTILELNGEIPPEVNVFSMMLLDDKVSSDDVDKIYNFLRKNPSADINPYTIYERYKQMYDIVSDPSQAVEGVIEYLKM